MEFIARQDPAVAASCLGVSSSQIDVVEKQYGIRLPSNYVNFIRTMGQSSGALRLFGASYDHEFSSLMAQLPAKDYPSDRFFKVAFESDVMAVAFEDLYLDLARSDGRDAPIVKFELPLELDDEVEDEPLSLSEMVIRQIFWSLAVARTKYAGTVMVFGQDASWSGQRIKQGAMSVLAQLGFSPSLPDLPRIACLSQDIACVLIEVSDDLELVAFKLGGERHDAVKAVAEALLAGVPNAEMKRRPSRRTEV